MKLCSSCCSSAASELHCQPPRIKLADRQYHDVNPILTCHRCCERLRIWPGWGLEQRCQGRRRKANRTPRTLWPHRVRSPPLVKLHEETDEINLIDWQMWKIIFNSDFMIYLCYMLDLFWKCRFIIQALNNYFMMLPKHTWVEEACGFYCNFRGLVTQQLYNKSDIFFQRSFHIRKPHRSLHEKPILLWTGKGIKHHPSKSLSSIA